MYMEARTNISREAGLIGEIKMAGCVHPNKVAESPSAWYCQGLLFRDADFWLSLNDLPL